MELDKILNNAIEYSDKESDRLQKALSAAILLFVLSMPTKGGKISGRGNLNPVLDKWKDDYAIFIASLIPYIKDIEKSVYEYYKQPIPEKFNTNINSYLQNVYDINSIEITLENYIYRAIISSEDIQVFTKEIVKLINGGLVKDIINTYITDLFAEYARILINSIADELKLKTGTYLGGLTKDSREFCVERNGKNFTREEIEDWNKLTWHGKIPGIDVKTQCGGYRCVHYIIWS